jgi:hypothetical protein
MQQAALLAARPVATTTSATTTSCNVIFESSNSNRIGLRGRDAGGHGRRQLCKTQQMVVHGNIQLAGCVCSTNCCIGSKRDGWGRTLQVSPPIVLPVPAVCEVIAPAAFVCLLSAQGLLCEFV